MFSPTGAVPYSRRAKLVMGVERIPVFVIDAMLVARAVNISCGGSASPGVLARPEVPEMTRTL